MTTSSGITPSGGASSNEPRWYWMRQVLLVATASALVSGCYGPEMTCGETQYPIKAAGGEGGQACVDMGSPPPSGWTTYPPGQTPTLAGEG